MPELVMLPGISLNLKTVPLIFYSCLVLMQGAQIAFTFHLSFLKMQEDLSPLLKRVFIYS